MQGPTAQFVEYKDESVQPSALQPMGPQAVQVQQVVQQHPPQQQQVQHVQVHHQPQQHQVVYQQQGPPQQQHPPQQQTVYMIQQPQHHPQPVQVRPF